ncbi:hypothetical protein E8E14_001213 [Neopestalotiopsis sp. 37M]|nr:hypothetical protein E8E14_001213 [Neopestalotiopsis sp. 37M]
MTYNTGGKEIEAPATVKIPYWRMVYDQAGVTDAVTSHSYPGSGTEEDPYLVHWIPCDPRNPMNFSTGTKWFITIIAALTTLAVTQIDAHNGKVTLKAKLNVALSRPWILLFKEPIVLLLSIYMAIVYGTLYLLFAAYPIVYQQNRGWSQGFGGLAFLGIMVGMLSAVAFSIFDNKRYVRIEKESENGIAPPEARLPPAMIGSIALPIGLFWFAWTNSPSIHWIVSIAAGAPFGFGMVLMFLSIMNYLIDSYTIYAASVLAANAVLRSLFGAAFPLFASYMYDSLGIHWASSIPAFLSLACVPFPFLFYKYGLAIRKRCNFAAESEEFMKKIQQQQSDDQALDSSQGGDSEEK